MPGNRRVLCDLKDLADAEASFLCQFHIEGRVDVYAKDIAMKLPCTVATSIANHVKPFVSLASPTGFEPVLSP